MSGLTIEPLCFSRVLSNESWFIEKNVQKVKDCKDCELLEKCVTAYNERVYNEWVDDYYNMTEEELELEYDDRVLDGDFPDTDYLPTFENACNKLCPQGWAWLIGDCDFGQNCGECKEPEAPIYAKRRQSSTTTTPKEEK